MSKVIMVQGTMSNVGKSLIVAGLCRIFKQDGYRVVPFKSQNMALNSYVTKDGFEMGRAQVMQAEAAGVEPSVYMNPILLKPTSDKGSQVIVNGEVLEDMNARDYFKYKKKLIPVIKEAFKRLEEEADIIVIEGAGSPAEINLRADDIVNMGMAELVDSNVLLVGDIDPGGVFAQIYGTVMLLTENERDRIKGLIINKFRGDKTLLDPGIVMLEEKTKKDVLGVVPYLSLSIDDEDSLSMRFKNKKQGIINIGIVHLPHISNFTDFNIFDQIKGVEVHYIKNPMEIDDKDVIILPGTKNVIDDMRFLEKSGLSDKIKEYEKNGNIIFGICGGYQLLGKKIKDPYNVEAGGEIDALSLLDVETVLSKEKIRRRVKGKIAEISGELDILSNIDVSGYEIHMGITKGNVPFLDKISEIESSDSKNHKETFLDGSYSKNIYGSYVHGIFDEKNMALGFIKALAANKNKCGRMEDTEYKNFINDLKVTNYKAFKEEQYDVLADTLRESLDMKKIYGILKDSVI